MSNIYKGQPYTVRLNTGVDVSAAISLQVRVKNMVSKNVVLLDATLLPNSNNATLEAFMPSASNTETGQTEHRAWIVLSSADPGVTPGDPFLIEIKDV
jgi:hypothetical protein